MPDLEPLAPEAFSAELARTLLCFVLVDAAGAHAFCSAYDFGPWPLLPGVNALPQPVLEVGHTPLLSTSCHMRLILLLPIWSSRTVSSTLLLSQSAGLRAHGTAWHA